MMKIQQATTKILNSEQNQTPNPQLLKPLFNSSNRKSPPTSRNPTMRMDIIARVRTRVTPTTRGPTAKTTAAATVSKEEAVVTNMATEKKVAIKSITREVIEAIDKIVPGTTTMKVVRKAVKANATKKIIDTRRIINLPVSTKSASTSQKST